MSAKLPKPYYQDSHVTLYCGDCREIAPLLPEGTIDVCLTSPPYNRRGPDSPKSSFPASGKWKHPKIETGYDGCADDLPHHRYVSQQRQLLLEVWRMLKVSGAVYYNHKPRPVEGTLRLPLEWFPLPLRQIVIWNRKCGVNFSTHHYLPMHEWLMIGAKEGFRLKNRGSSGEGDVWNISPEQGTWHPAPFPLDLARKVMETTGAQHVLDPYAGSGTTLIAAREAGARVIGIEHSRPYCAEIVKRLRANN